MGQVARDGCLKTCILCFSENYVPPSHHYNWYTSQHTYVPSNQQQQQQQLQQMDFPPSSQQSAFQMNSQQSAYPVSSQFPASSQQPVLQSSRQQNDLRWIRGGFLDQGNSHSLSSGDHEHRNQGRNRRGRSSGSDRGRKRKKSPSQERRKKKHKHRRRSSSSDRTGRKRSRSSRSSHRRSHKRTRYSSDSSSESESSYSRESHSDSTRGGNSSASETGENMNDIGRNKLLTKALNELVNQGSVDDNLARQLLSHSQKKPFKDRAVQAMRNLGLDVPDQAEDTVSFALSNPRDSAEKNTCFFPVSPMLKSRLEDIWRSMCGLQKGDSWDPSSFTQLPKPPDSLPKHKISEKFYKMKPNIFPEKGYVNEQNLGSKSTLNLSVSKLASWEQNISLALRVLNVVEIFTADVQNSAVDLLKKAGVSDATLDELKENSITRAKGIQDLGHVLVWLLGDMAQTHRKSVVESSTKSLSDKAKHVLKFQKLQGPYLFNGKAQAILDRDSKEATGMMARSMAQKPEPKKTNFGSNSNSSYGSSRPQKKFRDNKGQGKKNFRPSYRNNNRNKSGSGYRGNNSKKQTNYDGKAEKK